MQLKVKYRLMKLQQVIESLAPVQVKGSVDCEIKGVCHDSRHFQEGDLFVAIRGNQFDGHLFVPAACDRGAPAILLEDDRVVPMRYTGTVVKTKDTRRAIDLIAANFYGRPSEKLCVIGLTGTNGKTTTAHMIEAVLNHHQIPKVTFWGYKNNLTIEGFGWFRYGFYPLVPDNNPAHGYTPTCFCNPKDPDYCLPICTLHKDRSHDADPPKK